jgi:hypothetical protein
MSGTGPLTLPSPSSAHLEAEATPGTDVIHTPDQRLRVFVSSTLKELGSPERQAVRDAVTRLRLVPMMVELGARPHPAKQLYRAYPAQSQVFVGVYWQSYGWIAPGEQVSGLEGLSLATDTGDKPTTAYYLEALAGIASSQGSRRRAGRLRADAAALLQANGSGWLYAYVPRTADKEVRPHARHCDPA